MSIGLIITLSGLGVAGFSSLLGMWLERDSDKPKKIAVALSILIILATGVGMIQGVLDDEDQQKMEGDLARMLATLDKIASSSDVAIPELDALVKSELNAASRSNPDIVKKMAQRVADEGGDPSAVLGGYLDASEMQKLGRKGSLKVKPPAVAVMSVGKPPEKPRDRVRPTLADVASGKATIPAFVPPTAGGAQTPPPPPEPATAAAAPETAAPPITVAAARKAPVMRKLAPALKALPESPAKAAFENFKAPPVAAAPAAAAGAAKEKAAAELAAKQKAAEDAKKNAAAAAKKKADDAKKAAEAAAKKKADELKKKAKLPW